MGKTERQGRRINLRYFINNFVDHETQNSLNFLTGKIEAKDHPNYQTNKGENVLASLKSILFIPLIFITVNLFMGHTMGFGILIRITMILLFMLYNNVWSKSFYKKCQFINQKVQEKHT